MANILVIRLRYRGCGDDRSRYLFRSQGESYGLVYRVDASVLDPGFINRPKNVNVIGINTKSTEKTLAGLLRFASALVKYDFDMVLDLHDVLRTMILHKKRRNPLWITPLLYYIIITFGIYSSLLSSSFSSSSSFGAFFTKNALNSYKP